MLWLVRLFPGGGGPNNEWGSNIAVPVLVELNYWAGGQVVMAARLPTLGVGLH